MKTVRILLTFLAMTNFAKGQNSLIKDLDQDGVKDTVFVDVNTAKIVCLLSTLAYQPISSKPIEILNETAGITATKTGFEFFNDWMRAGYKNQFSYNSKTQKIQLIGMSEYQFGNAANDGSGEGKLNVLTSEYVGNWNYFDLEKQKLIKIPTIHSKITFDTIFLEDFSDETYFIFGQKSSELFEKHKDLKMTGGK